MFKTWKDEEKKKVTKSEIILRLVLVRDLAWRVCLNAKVVTFHNILLRYEIVYFRSDILLASIGLALSPRAPVWAAMLVECIGRCSLRHPVAPLESYAEISNYIRGIWRPSRPALTCRFSQSGRLLTLSHIGRSDALHTQSQPPFLERYKNTSRDSNIHLLSIQC